MYKCHEPQKWCRLSVNYTIPSFRISVDFPSFRLLGFEVIFRRSVIPLFRHSAVPSFRLLGSPVRSAIVNSFTSSVFPSEANGETAKTLSLLWKISLPSSGIQELKNSQAQRNKTDQTVHEAGLFRGSIVKTKHRSLTSLTFIQLVPGDDRVVRHICIRCIIPVLCT